jgi:putative tryptophan/tyrosine transport system substrate-binding protein
MTIGIRQQAVGNSRKLKLIACMLCAMLFAFSLSVQAQQPKKVYRIGYLSAVDQTRDTRIEAIRRGLREFGYIEGHNIAIEYRYAQGKRDRFPELAAELVRLKVDVIVAARGEPLIRSAMNATKSIAIVMTGSGPDPVEAGPVESFARPGGNVTGVTYLSTELGGKRLELLKEASIKSTRVPSRGKIFLLSIVLQRESRSAFLNSQGNWSY